MISKTTMMTMALLVGMLTLVPINASADVDADLVTYFTFDENLLDSSGNNNNGTITGTELYVDSELRGAIFLDDDSYITISNESNFDFERTDPFSFAFWYKMPDIALGNNWIYDKHVIGGDNEGISVYTTNNAGTMWLTLTSDTSVSEIGVKFDPTSAVVGFDDVDDGKWHHYVISYDGSSSASGVSFVVDGIDASSNLSTHVDTLTTSIVNNVSPLIGNTQNGADCTDCTLDDFRIYDVELTLQQSQELHRLNPWIHAAVAEATLVDLQSQITSLQSQVTSVNATVQHNVTEIDDLYDFWDDLRANIITWLAGRP